MEFQLSAQFQTRTTQKSIKTKNHCFNYVIVWNNSFSDYLE